MANVIFKFGTRAQYDALTAKDPNALYWLTDTQELMKGDARYGMGTSAAALAGLTPVDNTIVIADSEHGKSIGVKVSAESGNDLMLKNDGLFVEQSDVEFTMERQGTAENGYSATYKLKRIDGETSAYVGDSINIPIVDLSGCATKEDLQSVEKKILGTIGTPNAEQFTIDANGILNITGLDAGNVRYNGEALSDVLARMGDTLVWEEMTDTIHTSAGNAAAVIASASNNATIVFGAGTSSSAILLERGATIEGENAGMAQNHSQEVK